MNAPAPSRGGAVLTAAVVVYSAMAAAAWVWLWLRDRLEQVRLQAMGEVGLWLASLIGLVAGLGAALGMAMTARRFAAVRRCEARVASVLGPLAEGQVIALAMLSAIAEELFFRLAVFDALGAAAAVACYVAVNTGPGLLPWLPVVLTVAVMLTAMMATGCGLLAVTIAHALINYLALRRILPT